MTKFADNEPTTRRSSEERIDHAKTCSYRFRGELCHLPASMSHSTKGEGPWFCPGHFRGADAQAPHGRNWKDVTVDALIEPSDYRQPGETKSAYRERQMAKIRESLVKIGQRLPYNPDKKLTVEEYSEVPF